MRKKLFILLFLTPVLGMAQHLQSPSLKFRVKRLPVNTSSILPQTTATGGLTSSDTVITTPPSGEKRTYYMTRNFYDDNYSTSVYQCLAPVTMVFCTNNDVYIPNMVRDDFTDEAYGRVYVKGKLSIDGKKITIKNGQKLFDKNGSVLRLCLTDSAGLAGDTLTNQLYSSAIILEVSENGVLTPADDSGLIGLYPDGDVKSLYGYTSVWDYRPKDSVDAKTKKMNYEYIYSSNNNEKKTAIATKYVDDAGLVYVKGFVNKYPDAWAFLMPYKSDSLYLTSYQVIDRSYAIGSTLLFAATKAKTTSGNDTINAVHGMFLTEDANTGMIKSLDGSVITTSYIDADYVPHFPQQYESLVFSPITLNAVKPSTPTSLQYRKGSYTMIRFTLPETDVNGNALDLSSSYYRICINGMPYTFAKATYTKLKSDTDMVLIPWNYDDYDVISKSGTTRYIYFEGINTDTLKTIGVETVYIVNGEETTSDRLVYDVATQKTSIINGIATISDHVSGIASPIAIYGINGMRRKNISKGINIIHMSDGTTRKVIQ